MARVTAGQELMAVPTWFVKLVTCTLALVVGAGLPWAWSVSSQLERIAVRSDFSDQLSSENKQRINEIEKRVYALERLAAK